MFRILMALVAGVGLLACGGSSGGGATTGAPIAAAPQNQLVVELDMNGDDVPDVLTLDTSAVPFRIVEAIQGVPNGSPFDATAAFAGQPIDAALSDALAKHLTDSLNVASRTELELIDSIGRTVPVTVFE